ncbi:hypothetical protein KCP78_18650 [Salmonella enterica subsp. enterica]|nr:hypothetical protein KCP78_18650 [Salmonella enterica subsp. enterica]
MTAASSANHNHQRRRNAIEQPFPPASPTTTLGCWRLTLARRASDSAIPA